MATILPNSLELLEVYWAVAKMGAVVVPLSPLLRGTGLITLLKDSDTEMVITNKSFVEILNPIKPGLSAIKDDRYWLIDSTETEGYQGYQLMKAQASDLDPQGIELSDHGPL